MSALENPQEPPTKKLKINECNIGKPLIISFRAPPPPPHYTSFFDIYDMMKANFDANSIDFKKVTTNRHMSAKLKELYSLLKYNIFKNNVDKDGRIKNREAERKIWEKFGFRVNLKGYIYADTDAQYYIPFIMTLYFSTEIQKSNEL